MSTAAHLATGGSSSRIRYSEPPRRSTRQQSRQTTTDTSGAEDRPYFAVTRTRGRSEMATASTSTSTRTPRVNQAKPNGRHRKTTSFSKIYNLAVEVDATGVVAPRHGGKRRASRSVLEEDDEVSSERSHRTERTERSRLSHIPAHIIDAPDRFWTPRASGSRLQAASTPTPRANDSAKRRKLQVRPSLGASHALGEMTLDRRAGMVADIAGDCLIKLLAVNQRGGSQQARSAWDSLQALRHTYIFSQQAPPFTDLHSFVSALHTRINYNPFKLAQALELSNICTFIWTILNPDEAADLLHGTGPLTGQYGDTPKASGILSRNGGRKGKGRADEEDLDLEAISRVRKRNEMLLLAWRKFWVVAIPKDLRGSDSALRLWLDFATMIIRTWQSPSVHPASTPHPALPAIPDSILRDLFSTTAVSKYGQWESNGDSSDSEVDQPVHPDLQDDTAERNLVSRRWKELSRRRMKVLEEKRPELLARQFDWERFSSEMRAFVRIEVVDAGYMRSLADEEMLDSLGGGRGGVGKRAASEVSVKRRLSSNARGAVAGSAQRSLGQRIGNERDEDEHDMDTAESAVDEPNGDGDGDDDEDADDQPYRPRKSGTSDQVDFDMFEDIAREMEMEAEQLHRASRKPSTLSPKKRRISLPREAQTIAGDGYMADLHSFGAAVQELERDRDRDRDRYRRASRSVKASVSKSPAMAAAELLEEDDDDDDDDEWAIRDLMPATQDFRRNGRPFEPGRAQAGAGSKVSNTFNFASRQVNAEQIDWDSQTPPRLANGTANGTATPDRRQMVPRLSLTRPSDITIPTMSTLPQSVRPGPVPPETPQRAVRDITQEFVPTPGFFPDEPDMEEEEEVEMIEVLENVVDTSPEGSQEGVLAGRTEGNVVRGMEEGEQGEEDDEEEEEEEEEEQALDGNDVEMDEEDVQDGDLEELDDDVLPETALLRPVTLANGSRSHEDGKADGLLHHYVDDAGLPELDDEEEYELPVNNADVDDDDDDDIEVIEQPVRPAAQAAYISSRPRHSDINGDYLQLTPAEEEADRALLTRPAQAPVDRQRENTILSEASHVRDPDILIPPGIRRSIGIEHSRQDRSPSIASVDAYPRQPIIMEEPEPDPYLYDVDRTLLKPNPKYVLPRKYDPQRSVIHGRIGDQASVYSRISGRRKWSKEEEVLLYRTVQKVPLSEGYPLRVVWYLHGEFGVLGNELAEFNPQHMKDKMRVIVNTRTYNGRAVVGRARFWLPKEAAGKEEYEEEMQEWREAEKVRRAEDAEERRVKVEKEDDEEKRKKRKKRDKDQDKKKGKGKAKGNSKGKGRGRSNGAKKKSDTGTRVKTSSARPDEDLDDLDSSSDSDSDLDSSRESEEGMDKTAGSGDDDVDGTPEPNITPSKKRKCGRPSRAAAAASATASHAETPKGKTKRTKRQSLAVRETAEAKMKDRKEAEEKERRDKEREKRAAKRNPQQAKDAAVDAPSANSEQEADADAIADEVEVSRNTRSRQCQERVGKSKTDDSPGRMSTPLRIGSVRPKPVVEIHSRQVPGQAVRSAHVNVNHSSSPATDEPAAAQDENTRRRLTLSASNRASSRTPALTSTQRGPSVAEVDIPSVPPPREPKQVHKMRMTRRIPQTSNPSLGLSLRSTRSSGRREGAETGESTQLADVDEEEGNGEEEGGEDDELDETDSEDGDDADDADDAETAPDGNGNDIDVDDDEPDESNDNEDEGDVTAVLDEEDLGETQRNDEIVRRATIKRSVLTGE